MVGSSTVLHMRSSHEFLDKHHQVAQFDTIHFIALLKVSFIRSFILHLHLS